MSRALPDCDRRDIRVTIKISPTEEEILEMAGYTKKNRVKKLRDEFLKKARNIIKGK